MTDLHADAAALLWQHRRAGSNIDCDFGVLGQVSGSFTD